MTYFFKLILILFPLGSVYAQNVDDFNLCGDGKMYPYYYPELKYEGDFFAITSHFEINYDSGTFKDVEGSTGILTIQFHVNCTGETGNYKVKMVDLDFKETEMNEKLVLHILELTKELNHWIPAKSDNGETINSHKFLSFRMVDGEITEIYPK